MTILSHAQSAMIYSSGEDCDVESEPGSGWSGQCIPASGSPCSCGELPEVHEGRRSHGSDDRLLYHPTSFKQVMEADLPLLDDGVCTQCLDEEIDLMDQMIGYCIIQRRSNLIWMSSRE